MGSWAVGACETAGKLAPRHRASVVKNGDPPQALAERVSNAMMIT